MSVGSVLKGIAKFFAAPTHGNAKSFETEVEHAGITARVDAGMKTIPASKVVGSVGRSQNLRSDFFYRTGQAMTARFTRIGKAMDEGKVLPPIEVYKAKLKRQDGDREVEKTEYYVVDGHHRVAMAKAKGQDYLDAHVVEYRVAQGGSPASSEGTPAVQATPTGVEAGIVGPALETAPSAPGASARAEGAGPKA